MYGGCSSDIIDVWWRLFFATDRRVTAGVSYFSILYFFFWYFWIRFVICSDYSTCYGWVFISDLFLNLSCNIDDCPEKDINVVTDCQILEISPLHIPPTNSISKDTVQEQIGFSQPKVKKPKTLTSAVWKYFDKIGVGKDGKKSVNARIEGTYWDVVTPRFPNTRKPERDVMHV